jgi:ribonuclease HI
MEERKLYIFSDGGSFNNGHKDSKLPMYGSFCTIITDDNFNIIKQYCKLMSDMTNNQCELLGAMIGIHAILENKDNLFIPYYNTTLSIELCSDSQYVIKGIGEWLPNWKNNGWKNSSKKTIENVEQWQQVDELLQELYDTYTENCLSLSWVKGHQKMKNNNQFIYFNNLCDSLLTEKLNPIRKKFDNYDN